MNDVAANITDTVCRFIFSDKEFGGNKVKHNAFVPPNDYPNEISVCVTNELNETQIWSIGDKTRLDKTVKARGDLLVKDVCSISDNNGSFLKVMIDGNPHPRHANIKDIPIKGLRRAVAVSLADASKLIVK